MFAGPLVPRSLGEACCADYMLRHTYAVPVPSPRLAIASVGKRKEAQRRKTIVSNYHFLILGSECGAAALFVTRNASSRSRRRRSCLSSNPTSCLGPYVAYFILLARRDVPRCITVGGNSIRLRQKLPKNTLKLFLRPSARSEISLP